MGMVFFRLVAFLYFCCYFGQLINYDRKMLNKLVMTVLNGSFNLACEYERWVFGTIYDGKPVTGDCLLCVGIIIFENYSDWFLTFEFGSRHFTTDYAKLIYKEKSVFFFIFQKFIISYKWNKDIFLNCCRFFVLCQVFWGFLRCLLILVLYQISNSGWNSLLEPRP